VFSSVVLHVQHIRLAAHLAIFYVTLIASSGLVHRSLVPLAAAGALESTFHRFLIFNFPMLLANCISEDPYNGGSLVQWNS
jgi:hypothetical protein